MCDQLKYNKITEFIDEFFLQNMNKIFLNDIWRYINVSEA